MERKLLDQPILYWFYLLHSMSIVLYTYADFDYNIWHNNELQLGNKLSLTRSFPRIHFGAKQIHICSVAFVDEWTWICSKVGKAWSRKEKNMKGKSFELKMWLCDWEQIKIVYWFQAKCDRTVYIIHVSVVFGIWENGGSVTKERKWKAKIKGLF